MFRYELEVGVALRRPPREDRISKVVILAPDDTAAILGALAMTHRPDVVMPVRATILSVEL